MISNTGKRFKKSHYTGWEHSYLTSADLYMIVYGCGVSQYPQFYVKDLYMYQVLPRPYIGSFDGFTCDKLFRKLVLDLASQVDKFVWKCIETRITIDDIKK